MMEIKKWLKPITKEKNKTPLIEGEKNKRFGQGILNDLD